MPWERRGTRQDTRSSNAREWIRPSLCCACLETEHFKSHAFVVVDDDDDDKVI